MTTRLSDLNNHLFDQLDRLADTNQSPKDLEKEIKRTDAIVAVSDKIIANTRTQLGAAKLYATHGKAVLAHLPQIGSSKE